MRLFRRKPLPEKAPASSPSYVSSSRGQLISWADLNSYVDNALLNSAFWACLTNMARTMATLPKHLYKKEGKARIKIDDEVGAYLLKNPCTYMDPYSFYFILSLNYEMYGAAYAKVLRLTDGTPYSFAPIATTSITPQVKDGKIFYLYSTTGELISRDDMLVLMNVTSNGIVPLRVVDFTRTDLAMASAAKDTQTNFYKRGTNTGGILTVPRGTSTLQKDEVRERFTSGMAGAANSYSVVVMDESFRYEPIKVDSKSSEFVDAQKWTVTEVARRFGVPEFFAGGNTQEKYANAEQKGIDLLQFSILPRAVSWQDGFNRILSGPDQYTRIDLNGLLRGDMASRAAYIQTMINSGVYCINDARALDDMDPVDGGDVHMVPMNYVPLNIAVTTNPYNPMGMTGESCLPGINPIVHEANESHPVELMLDMVAEDISVDLEKVIAKQLGKAADILEAQLASQSGCKAILSAFKLAVKSAADDFAPQYSGSSNALAARTIERVNKYVSAKFPNKILVSVDDLKDYLATYPKYMASRQTAEQTKALALKLADISDDKVTDAVNSVVSSWRSDKTIQYQTTSEVHRTVNAFAQKSYEKMGFTKKGFKASPTACEFCKQLDGVVTDITGYVANKGDTMTGADGKTMSFTRSYSHPPVHGGCNCQIVPIE